MGGWTSEDGSSWAEGSEMANHYRARLYRRLNDCDDLCFALLIVIHLLPTWLVASLWPTRRLVLESGRRLTASGHLERAEHAFHCSCVHNARCAASPCLRGWIMLVRARATRVPMLPLFREGSR
jgi:hypothetical protein